MIAADELQEGLLVERAKHDPEAFGLLYDRYVGQVFAFAYNRLRDRTSAEDLTSEVFHRALRNIRHYQPVGPFRAWLYRIAKNAIVDAHRRKRPEPSLEEGLAIRDEGRSVADEVSERDLIGRIWTAVDSLPAAQRTAMRLRFDQDLTNRGAGDLMGKTSGAVKLLVHRAVQRLRTELAADAMLEVAK
jgi:RNA polymerase sigma-70 factor (ECF subfamily)